MRNTIRAMVRMAFYMTLLAAVVLIPHFIAYTIVPSVELPPCATEDSSNCVWDSRVQGNGQGNSFVDVDGTAYYFGG